MNGHYSPMGFEEELTHCKREDRRDLQGLHCIISNVTSSLAHLKGPRNNMCLPLIHQISSQFLSNRVPGDPNLRNLVSRCIPFLNIRAPKSLFISCWIFANHFLSSDHTGCCPCSWWGNGPQWWHLPSKETWDWSGDGPGSGAVPVNRWTIGISDSWPRLPC